MAYASIIEIVGIKELAEDDFQKFSEKTLNFKISAEQSINKTISLFKNTQLNLFIFRDHCYVESDNIDSLLSYIKELRISFFDSTHYFFRCVMTVGNLNIKEAKVRSFYVESKASKSEIRFMEYSGISTRLYAMMERFKGIGIMLDTENLEKDSKWEKIRQKTFTNFYITDITNKKYQSYTDISIDSNDRIFHNVKEIFERMYYDKMYSKKLARFYVPLLINLAKNYDLKLDINSEYSMGKIIGKNIVSKNKDVTGFEFFFYMLIERIFDPIYNKNLRSLGFADQISEIETNLAKNNWLLDLLRNDTKFSDIPKEILSNSKRRIVLRTITYVIQQMDKM